MTAADARLALQTAGGWFKSSYSGANGGCVEVNLIVQGVVGVRDTKLADASPILVFDAIQWHDWLTEVAADDLTNTNDAVVVTVHNGMWEVCPVDDNTEPLRFNEREWAAFRAGVRAGQFASAT